MGKQEQLKEMTVIISTAYDLAKCDRKSKFGSDYAAKSLQKNGYGKLDDIIDKFVKKLDKRMGIAYDSTIVAQIAAEFKEELKK